MGTHLPRVKREKCSSIVSTQHSSVAGLLSFCQICTGGQRPVAVAALVVEWWCRRTPTYEIPILVDVKRSLVLEVWMGVLFW